MESNDLDIVIPVYNEESSLERNVLRLYAFLLDNLPDKKWIVTIADNGSFDETASIAAKLVKDKPQIRYVRTETPGVGAALKKAWKSSSGILIGSMDLDLSTDMAHIKEAVMLFSDPDLDLVYGSRLHKKSEVSGRKISREIISRIFNSILKNYLRVHINDGMCGFAFFKRTMLGDLLQNGALSDGWFFQAEILVVTERLGYKIHELPVKWQDDPDSKVKVAKLSSEYLKAMRKLKKYRNPDK